MARTLIDKYGAPSDPTEALLELANELVVGVFADKYDEKKRLREKREDRDYAVRSQEISTLRREGYDGNFSQEIQANKEALSMLNRAELNITQQIARTQDERAKAAEQFQTRTTKNRSSFR